MIKLTAVEFGPPSEPKSVKPKSERPKRPIPKRPCQWAEKHSVEEGLSLPYEFDWPAGVPRDNDELVRDYGDYIAKQVRRYNQIKRNYEDLLQEIFMKLFHSRLLEKFIESGARRLPATMTAVEACAFLGVRFQQWRKCLHRNDFLPDPVKGTRYSKAAVFETRQVIEMDNAGGESFWKSRPLRRVRPGMTARGFKTYLQRAIHNHFANHCRTNSRKNKEQLLSPSSVVICQDAGVYRTSSAEIEDSSGWENNLVAPQALPEEEAVDLITALRKVTSVVDLESDTGREVLDHLQKQGRCRNGDQRNRDTLDYLAKGYSLAEIVKLVDRRARFRQKAEEKIRTKLMHG